MEKRILLADDESGIREPWGDMLVQQGFRVVLAADGNEAFELFEAQEEPFDLLIIDALMPGRDGFKLVRDIRNHSKGRTVPVMMVSGVYRSAQHANHMYNDFNVQVYLDKPVTPEKLLHTARKLMGLSNKAAESSLNIGDVAVDKHGPFFALNPQDAPAIGKLSAVPLPVILYKLFRIKATGELALQKGADRKSILFEKGRIITATSNIAEEYLGETLARVGRITKEQNLASLEISEKTGQRQGDILLKQGWLHSHELPRYLRMQTEERLLRAFMWTDADYAFKPMQAVPGQNVVVERNTPTAIKDGIMMNMPVAWLEEHFYPAYGNYYIGYVQGSEPLLKMVFFNRKQLAYLCHGVDYSLTLNQARESADVSDEEAARILYAWVTLGLAKLVPANAKTPKPGAFKTTAESGAGGQGNTSTEAAVVRGRDRPQDLHVSAEMVASLTDEQKAFLEQMLQYYRKVQDKNYFEILGVHENADDREIKSNYFKLARMFHPDSLPHKEVPVIRQVADKVFSVITRAHGTISNPQQRENYIKVLKGESDDATEIAMDILNAEQKFLEAQGEIKRRNWKRAHELINEALALHADEGEFVATRVWARFHLDGGEENRAALTQALIDMRRAVEKAPKADQIHFYLGELYKLSGKLVDAYKAFAKAFELNPHHSAARSEIRMLQVKLSEQSGKKDGKGVLGGLFGKKK